MLYTHATYIFDLDGTMANSAPDIIACLQVTCAMHAVPVRPIDRFEIGPPVEEIIHGLLPQLSADQVDTLVTTFRKQYDSCGIPLTALYPGIPGVLHMLSERGAKLFVATNKSRISARKVLAHLGIEALFTDVLCCDSLMDSLDRRISKAEMINHILQTYGAKPEDTVMIGDSPHDIEGGKAAGVRTLGVLYGYAPAEAVRAAAPDAVVCNADWSDCLR